MAGQGNLACEVHHKLEELENKVQAYRHNMIAEFQRYYRQLIEQATPEETLEVQLSFQSTLPGKYPSLNLAETFIFGDFPVHESSGSQSLPSPGLTSPKSDTTVTPHPHPSTPPPIAVFGPSVAQGQDQGIRRSHEREKEFHGLFTPDFLPLLECSPIQSNSPPSVTADASDFSASPSLSQLQSHAPVASTGETDVTVPSPVDRLISGFQAQPRQGQNMEGLNETGVIQSGASVASASLTQLPRRPSPTRRGTGDTTSSAVSDKSDSKIPRSALRRSSSASRPGIQSPRRVRFEFEGAEVLPTASPQPHDFHAPQSHSHTLLPEPSDDNRTFDEIVGHQEQDDEPYLPRKITSTEALRQLSRKPLDEETTWTVVNPDISEIATNEDHIKSPVRSKPAVRLLVMAPKAIEAQQRLAALDANAPLDKNTHNHSDQDSSEDEFLSIRTSKPAVKRAVVLTPNQTIKADTSHMDTKVNASSSFISDEKDQASSEDYDLDDDMFHFESGGLSAPPRPKKPESIEEEPEESPPSSPQSTSESVVGLYATSPAVRIPKTNRLASISSTTTAARFTAGSLGSYKGKLVMMPVVKNPELLAQAESLGEFNTFVGGLDGRSGMDDGDLSSFRASIAQDSFNGEPRSLSERLMMEEALGGDRNSR